VNSPTLSLPYKISFNQNTRNLDYDLTLDCFFNIIDNSSILQSHPIIQEFSTVVYRQQSILNDNIEEIPCILNKYFELYKYKNSYSYIFNRLKEILNADDLYEENIYIDKDSFDSLYNFIKNGYMKEINFAIGISTQGEAILQKVWNEKKYIYIKFLKNNKIMYNVVYQKWNILNETGNFDEYIENFSYGKKW